MENEKCNYFGLVCGGMISSLGAVLLGLSASDGTLCDTDQHNALTILYSAAVLLGAVIIRGSSKRSVHIDSGTVYINPSNTVEIKVSESPSPYIPDSRDYDSDNEIHKINGVAELNGSFWDKNLRDRVCEPAVRPDRRKISF